MRHSGHRLSHIGDFASAARTFLEPRWLAWKIRHGRPIEPLEAPSAGMCGFTSVFMARYLEVVDGGRWRVDGGKPLTGGGIRCASGRQNGHFWTVSGDGIIVDLTADQFGLPSVMVTTEDDPRFLSSLAEQDVLRHLPKVEGVAAEWLDEAAAEGLVPRYGWAA